MAVPGLSVSSTAARNLEASGACPITLRWHGVLLTFDLEQIPGPAKRRWIHLLGRRKL
jgi:hypothetical protein